MYRFSVAFLLVAATLLVSTAAHADPRHSNDRGWRGHDRGKHYHQHHRPNYHHYKDRNRSSFSLNIITAPRPVYYSPYNAAYNYYPQPVMTVPAPTYYNAQPINYTAPATMYDDGRYCREYTSDVLVGGRVQQSYGRACMQPDGSWEIDS
jgi:hypothetical protein